MPTFMGFMVKADGYGIASMKIGALLARHGWGIVDMTPVATSYPAASDANEGVDTRSWTIDEATLAMCVPDWLARFRGAGPVACYTMFESSRLPAGRVEMLNERVSGCIVPCEWCREMFVENGVRAPIRIAPLGLDGRDFPLLPRFRLGGEPYTFLWSGTPDKRKGWDLAYRGFVKAFGKRPDVQLILHFREMPKGLTGVADPNVRIVAGQQHHIYILEMLSQADCFLFPSRGEGWGQPPREAAATGLPAIATDWGGLSVGLAEWGLPLRVKGTSPAWFGWWQEEDLGEWAEPDLDHLIELMRWCEGHRAEAAARGLAASAWLRSHATWEQTAEALLLAWDEMVGARW
jgi:glycosyltransferase involved in cell wall biosynthesis